MRVLLVNDLDPAGGSGAEIALARNARGLRQAGDEVDLFAGQVVHQGVAKVLDMWDPRARRLLERHVERFRPDVIHYHHVARELSPSVLTVADEVPKVLTVHDFRLLGASDGTGRAALDLYQRLKSVLDRRVALRRVQLVIAVSEPLADALREAGFPRVVHLANMVDEDLVPPERRPPSECCDIVFVGRLTRDKGVVELVRAFASIRERHPATRLVIVGDGPLAHDVASAAAAESYGARIELLGRVDAHLVAALLANARVVAIPSIASLRPEGLPLVAMEAGVSGRPVVAGDDPGLRQYVGETGGGLVVRGGDVAELASALDRLLSEPELADSMGAAARSWAVRRYTIAAVTKDLRDLYASVTR